MKTWMCSNCGTTIKQANDPNKQQKSCPNPNCSLPPPIITWLEA